MKNENIQRSAFHINLPLGLIVIICLFSHCQPINNISDRNTRAQKSTEPEVKQRGAHVFGILDSTNFEPLIQNNLEWVTMVSWGFQDNCDSPIVTHHNGDSSYMLRHNHHWQTNIEKVRAAGFKVFF